MAGSAFEPITRYEDKVGCKHVPDRLHELDESSITGVMKKHGHVSSYGHVTVNYITRIIFVAVILAVILA